MAVFDKRASIIAKASLGWIKERMKDSGLIALQGILTLFLQRQQAFELSMMQLFKQVLQKFFLIGQKDERLVKDSTNVEAEEKKYRFLASLLGVEIEVLFIRAKEKNLFIELRNYYKQDGPEDPIVQQYKMPQIPTKITFSLFKINSTYTCCYRKGHIKAYSNIEKCDEIMKPYYELVNK